MWVLTLVWPGGEPRCDKFLAQSVRACAVKIPDAKRVRFVQHGVGVSLHCIDILLWQISIMAEDYVPWATKSRHAETQARHVLQTAVQVGRTSERRRHCKWNCAEECKEHMSVAHVRVGRNIVLEG